MTDQPRSGADILAEINPTSRTGVAHINMRPDLTDQFYEANDALIAAQAEEQTKSKNRMNPSAAVSDEVRALAEQVRAIEEQIEAADLAFTFRKIDKSRHAEICDENPPRDGNMMDWQVGYNREAVDNAVVLEALVDPVFEPCGRKSCKHEKCGSWEALLKLIGPGEWDEMVTVVREVMGAVKGAPKSQLASAILDRPVTASRRRARGA